MRTFRQRPIRPENAQTEWEGERPSSWMRRAKRRQPRMLYVHNTGTDPQSFGGSFPRSYMYSLSIRAQLLGWDDRSVFPEVRLLRAMAKAREQQG